ncbi:IS4 family transposase [Streptomyces chartreusis]|uniref:IS4 family transposase n=1 Tax=Streptomyces chartreusis TaxID=1969 RepID=A0A7H8T2K6_STRCX|nr:IS4 family transposase [Streptomyces chartreusis]
MSADVGELSGLGLLTWVYRPGLVDRVVAACGRAEHRRRLLPARLVVYFVLALALFSPAPYLEVMRHLVEGLRGQGLLGDWHIPAKSSLFRARQRLGSEPLRVLFATPAKPMGTEATPGSFWRGLRLLAVDGTCWDVADSPANEAAFGRPGNGRGQDKSCFPHVRMACLIEVGTHLVLDAELAGCRTGEVTLVSRLPRSCGPGEMVLADREFLGVPMWRAFTGSGADLLWRVPANRILPVERMLWDGSWLLSIHAHTDRAHSDPVTVWGIGLSAARHRPRRRGLPAGDQPARCPSLSRPPAGCALSGTLGGRGCLRRAQDPSTRSTRRAHQQDARRRPAADLGPPAGPSRAA